MDALGNEQLTYEEVVKVTKALKHEEFGDLFKSYLDEISDPSHRKEYEQYLSDMEKKGEVPRGKKLVRAKAGVCLSSHLLFKNGQKQKIYINLCQTPEISVFSISQESSNISLPHVISPPRVDRDENSQQNCLTADLAVHPQTLNACMRDRRILKILVDVVAESLTKNFFRSHETVSRDFKLEKFPCKGDTPMPMSVNSTELTDETPCSAPAADGAVGSVSPADIQKMKEEASAASAAAAAASAGVVGPPDTETPENMAEITYRMMDCESVDIGTNTSSIKIIFTCPKIVSAKELDLDVSSFTVSLKTKTASVSVDLEKKFPSGVDGEKVKAKFDKSKKELVVEIPILKRLANEAHPTHLNAIEPDSKAVAATEALPALVELSIPNLDSCQPQPASADDQVADSQLVDEQEAGAQVEDEQLVIVDTNVVVPAVSDSAQPADIGSTQLSFAGQNRLNVFYRTDIFASSAKFSADRTCVLVSLECAHGTVQWPVAFPAGHFIDKRQVHVSVSDGEVWLVCRKSTVGEWKELSDPSKQVDLSIFEAAPAEVAEAEAVADSPEAEPIRDRDEDFAGLDTYCHGIRLQYPWLYALF